jgi:hypothetical protein
VFPLRGLNPHQRRQSLIQNKNKHKRKKINRKKIKKHVNNFEVIELSSGLHRIVVNSFHIVVNSC